MLKRKILAAFILISAAAVLPSIVSADNLLITQVLYDPITTETGGEAIEIFNPTNRSVDISLWTLKTEASAADATIPNSTILEPGSYYLIADSGWNASKDNPAWRNADHEEAITLANADAGVALANGTAIIDAAGWGNASNINAGLFEGTPAPHVAEGKALIRKFNLSYQDTGNNSADFYAAGPNFNPSAANISNAAMNITVNATIVSSPPVIDSLQILTDDSPDAGVQVLPSPKSNRSVMARAQVSDENGFEDIAVVSVSFRGKSFNLSLANATNSTTALYQGFFSVPYYTAPQVQVVNASATDFAQTLAFSNTSFAVLPLLAFELGSESIGFSASPGYYSEHTALLYNIGNTALDTQLSGSNLSRGGNQIDVSSVQYGIPGATLFPLSYSRAFLDLNLSYGEGAFRELAFRFNAPRASPAGNYIGSILIAGVASD